MLFCVGKSVSEVEFLKRRGGNLRVAKPECPLGLPPVGHAGFGLFNVKNPRLWAYEFIYKHRAGDCYV